METMNEKVYCMPCSKDNTAEMMALMNNQNQWGNNPFIYLVWMMFAQRMWGANGADLAGDNYNSRQISALQDSVNTNHNNDIALQAINGNREALGQLAQTFNCDINAMQTAICNVKSAIEQVGGQIGYSSESVKNAIALGDANIIQQMQSCCCQNKMLVQEMGYKNELNNCQQTNTITSAINEARQASVNGFANIGYTMAQQTCELKTNQNENTQRIIDTLNSHWQSETSLALQDEKFKNSQLMQNQYIASLINGNNCGCN